MPLSLLAGQRITFAVPPQATVAITPGASSSARVTQLGTPGTPAQAPQTITAQKKVVGLKTTPLVFEVVCVTGRVDMTDPVVIDEVFDPSNVNLTGGAINGTPIGQTTPAAVKTSNLGATFTDSTSTPGNVTNNSPSGRIAFGAGQSTVTVTSSLVSASSRIFCDLNSVDGALTSIVTCKANAGSFTVTANGASTGTAATFDFLVVN